MVLFLNILWDLQVWRAPLYLEVDVAGRVDPPAGDAAGEGDGLCVAAGQAGRLLLQPRHAVPDPRHLTRVEEVEDAGGEGKFAEFELHPGPLEPLAGRGAFDAFPGAGLGRAGACLREVTVHVAVEHGLQDGVQCDGLQLRTGQSCHRSGGAHRWKC